MRSIETPWKDPHGSRGTFARELPEEVPVALVYDGETLAVTMATPEDLEDFAVGFSLTEGLSIRSRDVELLHRPNGIECRLSLDSTGRAAFERRRRATTGVSACGLCGVRSLAQALPVPPSVGGRDVRLRASDVNDAVNALRDHQPLHDRTRAAHAAALFVPGRGLVAVREDVGRHNALDKLAGALARAGEDASRGAVVLTSRVSVEMVQKSAALGAAAILAVSAPTSLAVRTARAVGLTLIGNVRRGRHETFAHAFRLVDERPDRTSALSCAASPLAPPPPQARAAPPPAASTRVWGDRPAHRTPSAVRRSTTSAAASPPPRPEAAR